MKSVKPAILLVLLLAVSVTFVGCGGGSIPPVINPLVVTTRSLPTAVVNTSYSATLAVSGGQGPFTWSLITGSLPNGLSLSSAGVISGTPTVKGSSPITVQVTDSQKPTAAIATGALTLTVNDALVITTKTLKNGAVNVPYSANLTASGGALPYTWAVVSGSLPPGLTLQGSIIAGTPTTEGTFSFSISVTDAEKPPVVAKQDYNITIGGAVGRLSGNYAFMFRGFKNGKLVLQTGSFISDGAGNITSGVMDSVSNGGTGIGHVQASISGTYTLNDSGQGTMNLFFSVGGGGTYQIASNTAGYFSYIQNGDGQATASGAGIIKVQGTIPVDVSGFAGNWVFGGYGADNANLRYAAAGTYKVTDSSGTIGNGLIDSNDNGTITTGTAFSGSILAPDATTGRGTLSFGAGLVTTGGMAYYYVGPSNGSIELFAIDTDPGSVSNPIIMYTLRKQNNLSGGYTNAAVQGATLSEISAVPSANSPDVSLGLLDFDGKGTVYATIDENAGGTLSQNKFTATYSVDSTGRTTFTGWGGSSPVMYLWSFEDGFILGTDAGVAYGDLEFQNIQSNTHTPSNADFKGAYSGGTLGPVVASQTVEVDTTNADGATPGNLTGTYDISGGGNPPQQGLNLTATYNIDTNCPATGTYGYTTCGRFPLLDSQNNQIGVGYMVNIFGPNRVVILKTNTAQPVLNFLQK